MAGKRSDTIAIDVLLEPDAHMLAHAEANNARLRAVFPDGFALDATHRPHITMLQCFVAAKGLEAFYAAVGDVLRNARVTRMALQAVRYYYEPAPGAGLAGICVAPTPELLELQADVMAASAPYMLATATIDAFTGGHENAAYDTLLIDYVSGFTAKYAGADFNPHVTTGVAPIDFLDRMIAEPFVAFAFAPAGAAVYQIGPFGTAARLLERWS